MTTLAQIRGACALLGIEMAELRASARLVGEHEGDLDAQALSALSTALEERGILFLAPGSTDSGGPGLRLRATHETTGIRPEDLNSANDD